LHTSKRHGRGGTGTYSGTTKSFAVIIHIPAAPGNHILRATGMKDGTAQGRHPLEEGDPCLFNYLKEMDFAPLPNMARLLMPDTRAGERHPGSLRLIAVVS
jgi:hypothetical protein